MSAKATGLIVFYCLSLPALAALWWNHRTCRREGRETYWFFSALSHVIPPLLLIVPLMLYAEKVVAAIFVVLVVLLAIGLRFWASYTFLTSGGIRPFRYRSKRRAVFADDAQLGMEERENMGREWVTPPHP